MERKKDLLTPEQVMGLIQMADSIHKLQERLQQLQSEVLDISIRKSVGNEELEDLHEEVEAVQAKLNLVNKTFNMKYEELKEVYSQLQMLQNYVEQFKNNQDYKELEVTVRSEVGKILLDNKKLLQKALVSVIVALRSDPNRHLLIDRM